MASVHTGSGLEAIERLFTTGTATAVGDTELLERFVSQEDAAAFEVLLYRHGPMVLRVCRRVLNDPNDVDDAFQATFLILVRRAASIRERTVLGTWLFGVARRVAVRARVNARRRNSREQSQGEPIAIDNRPEKRAETCELRALIDDELERLPHKYRSPMVLCELEGQTHEQAAAQLRCPVGTVKSRLSRGRERLRARLIRRGVAPAVAMASLLTDEPASAVPVALIKPTVRVATQFLAARVLPAGLACLMRGVTHSMIISQLKTAAVVTLAAAVTLAGIVTVVKPWPARPTLVGEPPARGESSKKAAVPLPEQKPIPPAEPGSERYVLENGLTVILRPIRAAKTTALVVLYSIGSDYDPPGQSGLAHLLEHVYVTAAAGPTKARTATDFMRRYISGANAQTGDRYTVIATVFPENDLETEIKDAAARMGELRLDADDLERERPRLQYEVTNMFGQVPALAAMNHARELCRPTPGGGRRGGLPEQVRDLTLEKLQFRWKSYYKPRNALLVLAGAIDLATARKMIATQFGQLPPGEDLPPPTEPLRRKRPGQIMELKVRALAPDFQSTACLAYAAPSPGSDLYAPFLLLAARLWAGAGKLGNSGPTGSPVYFAPLDDGAVIAMSTTAKPGESAADAFKRLEDLVAETIAPKLGLFERMTGRQQFGFSLGLLELSDNVLANNPYGLAFSLGRRNQLNLRPAELRRAWDAITDDQLRRVAREVFAPELHAGAFIAVEK